MSAVTHFKPHESSFETSFGHRISITHDERNDRRGDDPYGQPMTCVWSKNSPRMLPPRPASAA